MLINGKILKEGEKIIVYSPYSEDKVGEVTKAGKDQVPYIIETAKRGASLMKKLSWKKRGEMLNKAAENLQQRKMEFAKLLVKEAGKTITDAVKETERAVNTLKESAIAAAGIQGCTVPLENSEDMGRLGYYQRVPVGIVLAITPFNFPLNLACHKIGPALAAGNAVILKPASKTPLSSILLGQIVIQAGFPPEAISVVCGDGGEIGNLLAADPRVRKVSFTGSYETGKNICMAAGVKKITMELGSTGAVIVTPHTDIKKAAAKICKAGFANGGQVCISVQRVYVHTSIQEELITEMKKCAEQINSGNPMLPETELGPMITKKALKKAMERIEQSLQTGGSCVIGNQNDGNILLPTILRDVPESAPVIQEEMFAPVITVNGYNTLSEAISCVNGTNFGLQAGVFTDRLEEAMVCIDNIECGSVIINDTCNFREDQMPYGGVKCSGIGKEGPKYAVEEMTEIKMIILNRKV